MSHRRIALLLLTINAAGYSLLNIATRLLGEGFQPLTQGYLRLALGAFIGSLVFANKIRFDVITKTSRRDWVILILMGSVGYGLFIYFITLGALQAKLLNISAIYGTIAFFTYIYSVYFLKKKFDIKVILLIGLSLLGISMLATKSFVPILTSFGRGEFFVFLAAAVGAFYFVGRKMLSKHLNNSEITVITLYIATGTAFVLSLIAGESIQFSGFTKETVLLGLAIGGSFNIFATFIENYAFSHLEAVTGSQILLLENVFAVVFGFFLYKEIISLPEAAGALLLIMSVFWANKTLEI